MRSAIGPIAFKSSGLRVYASIPDGGASPVFFPRSQEQAKREMDQVVHQTPRDYGIDRTRWRLEDLRQALDWLEHYSLPGMSQLLARLKFSLKAAAGFIHSPDPAYPAKWERICEQLAAARANPQRMGLLYLDELTYYRWPSLAPAYARQGQEQPRALRSPGSNTQTRLVAILNAVSGQVTYLQRSKVGSSVLVSFYALVRSAYPDLEPLYVVQDNWPVHKLPEVFAAMQTQRLTPLWLPTYASWLNPIEKLWKWLKQQIIHLHPWVDDLETLRGKTRAFLDQFQTGSPELLRYVGLSLE